MNNKSKNNTVLVNINRKLLLQRLVARCGFAICRFEFDVSR